MYGNEYLRCAIITHDKVPVIRSSANPLIKIRNEYTTDKIERQYKKEIDLQHFFVKIIPPSKYKAEMVRLGIISVDGKTANIECRKRISCSICKIRRCLV